MPKSAIPCLPRRPEGFQPRVAAWLDEQLWRVGPDGTKHRYVAMSGVRIEPGPAERADDGGGRGAALQHEATNGNATQQGNDRFGQLLDECIGRLALDDRTLADAQQHAT